MKYYMIVTMRHECEVEAENFEEAEYEAIVDARENAWFKAEQSNVEAEDEEKGT